MAQITEMTKPDHSVATVRVKLADKMVMLPLLFDSTKPEVAKQHYKRFNQYIKFQMKIGNIREVWIRKHWFGFKSIKTSLLILQH